MTPAAPTFSVVIPAYQAAPYVADAVRSALEQTLEAHEVIVCDDGSTDDLDTALRPFVDRLTLLHRPHRGVAAARNAAVDAASGEFVVMLDADDVFERERLAALNELAGAKPDLDILATDLWYEEAGVRTRRYYELIEFPRESQRLAILESCFVACPALRRSRVLEVGGFDESLALGEDWDLFIRMVLAGSRAGLVDRPLLRYRMRPGSATADRPRALAARVAVLQKTRLQQRLTADERRFLDRCLTRARARATLSRGQALAVARPHGFRRSLASLAVASDVPADGRIGLVLSAVSSRTGRRLLARAERRVARSRPSRSR